MNVVCFVRVGVKTNWTVDRQEQGLATTASNALYSPTEQRCLPRRSSEIQIITFKLIYTVRSRILGTLDENEQQPKKKKKKKKKKGAIKYTENDL